ncbi:MAG: VOC family protein [Pseudomonas marincola]
MIGYTTIGTNDFARSASFYDTIFEILSAVRMMEEDDFIVWGTDENSPAFSIHLPADGNPATIGNGVMVALKAKNTEQVAAVHAKALELGGSNEGEPGPRGHGFYAGYFRDLDGNKLNIHCMA